MIDRAIQIKRVENEFSQNTYLIEFNDSCMVVDAGCGVDYIRNLTDKPIMAVLVTHSHFDHIRNIAEYDRQGIVAYIHHTSQRLLQDVYGNASMLFNQPTIYNINNISIIKGDQDINIGDHLIKCIYTPGHTIDGVCYLIDNQYLFSGDTVFASAVGRDDLPSADTNQLINSLERILGLDYKYLYTGHGRPSDKVEQQQNIPKWLDYLREKENKNYG